MFEKESHFFSNRAKKVCTNWNKMMRFFWVFWTKMNQIYLTRVVNNRARYLKIEYGKTLFDDLFLLKKSYGSVKNSKATGEKKIYFIH